MRIRMFSPLGAPQTEIWTDAFEAAGLSLEVIGLEPAENTVRGILRLSRNIKKESRRIDATIVHSLGTHGLLALLFGLKGQITVVPWGTEVISAERSWIRRKVAARLLQRSNKIIVTSGEMANTLGKTWKLRVNGKIRVVSWGVDTRLFTSYLSAERRSQIRKDYDCDDSTLLIVSPRGNKALYRPELVRNACEAARNTLPKLKLVEVGHRVAVDGERTGSTHIQAGWLTKLELAELFFASDAVVSIPTHDQRATVVIEAIATGTNVFTSPIAPYYELREDGADITISSGRLISDLTKYIEGLRPRRTWSNVPNTNWALLHEDQRRQFEIIIGLVCGSRDRE